MKVVAYDIMERDSRARLMLDMEALLKNGEGWDVAGGVAVSHKLVDSRMPGGAPRVVVSYLQAVVKREHTLLR